jgi:hypothetical protein
LLARFQAPVHRATDKQLAEASALLVATAGQASHAKAGDGVARQSFAVCLREVLYVDFSGTERVVAQDDGTVAQISGTSVAMIERHYGHLRSDVAAGALARLAL